MRNVAAFHVPADVIERGLVAMEADGTAILCEGEGPKMDGSSIRLGLEALLNGTGRTVDDFNRFFETVSEDHGISSAIQEAFLLALDTKGIPYGEVWGGDGQARTADVVSPGETVPIP